LSEDQILLLNIKDFDGERIAIALRQVTAEDLDAYEILQSSVQQGKITNREMDERSIARLIIKWGDRESMPTSLELRSLPVETRAVLLEVFQSFCMPSYEIVAAEE